MTKDKGIFIQNIYYMLTYAFQELKQNNFSEIASEQFDDIEDLFAEILARGISYQLKQGLHKKYIACHDSLSTLKGKLDINGTIKNLIQNKNKLNCNYEELSENNTFNKILKTTSLILLKSKKVKQERRAKLKTIMLYFSNVDSIEISSIKWTLLRFDRNSKTYRMLLYICYFILDGMLLSTEKGTYKIKEFTDEHMCRLFEKFVLEFYKKHHPELKPNAAKIQWNIDKEDSSLNMLPSMQTDILLTFHSRTLIIDTKYYRTILQQQFDKKTIHSNNLYQIHTYVINCDAGHTGKVDGMLLYAKTEEDIVPDGHISLRDGNAIYFKTLDLNQKFDKIKNQLNGFIKGIDPDSSC